MRRRFYWVLTLAMFSPLFQAVRGADDTEFAHIGKAFRYWFRTKNLIDSRNWGTLEYGDFFELGAITFDKLLTDPQFPWKIYRTANYDWNGNEAPVFYSQLQISPDGTLKQVLTSGYYFIYKGSFESGERLIVQPSRSGEYYKTEGLYVTRDRPVVIYSDTTSFESFQKTLIEHLSVKNIYKGGVLHFKSQQVDPSSAEFLFRFMENVGALELQWSDLILPEDLRQVSYDQTEGFIGLFPFLMARGFTPKKGVILAGPPGTGKSLLGQILISSILKGNLKQRATLILVTARHLRAKHAIKTIFNAASMLSPTIIFMEDMDLLGTQNREGEWARAREQTARQGEILNEFLNGIDGLVDNKGVLVVGTTNKWREVDPALLRSRLGIHLYFDLPKYSERKLFFEKFAKKNAVWASDISLEWLASESEGMSGADIVEWIGLTKQRAFEQGSFQEGKLLLNFNHFMQALKALRSKIDGNGGNQASSLKGTLEKWNHLFSFN